MNLRSIYSKSAAFLLLAFLLVGQVSAVRPLFEFPGDEAVAKQENEAKKSLPKINYIRSREIDVRNVLIDLRFDWENSQAYGSTEVTLAPFKDTDKIHLDAAEMKINSAVLKDGTALKFNYAGGDADNNLEILLPRIYKRGEELTVKIDYRTSYVNSASGDTAIGSFGRGLRFINPKGEEPNKPRQIWSQGETEFNRYWFPSYDSPNDFRTSELIATVDKKYTVVSNGKLIKVKDNSDGTRTFDWKMDVPYSNYLTSIVVAEYKEVKNGEYAGIPVVAYGYPNESKEVALSTRNIVDMVKFFSEKTGVKYPYPKYSQAMVEDFGGGMENISATTQIAEMIHDERELLDQNSDSLQAHELAHQWFGDYVTTRDWGQIWLNESFATYFDALYQEYKGGHDSFLFNDVRNNQDQTLQTWAQGNRRPIVTKYYDNKDAMFDTYAYPGGGSVLHMLRKHLGDENWWKAINHYLTSNAHQPVSTEDFRIAIEEATGQSMDWFFDQWLYRMGHPVFEVTKSYDSSKNELTMKVKQTQKLDLTNEFPQTEFFQTFVEIEIDGKVSKVWIKPQAENVFKFSSSAEPKIVNFDYEGTLLKELKFQKSTDELIYQLANDKDIIGRNWAMDELVKSFGKSDEKSKISAALVGTAGNDPAWELRSKALSEIRRIAVPRVGPGMKAPPANFDEATLQLAQKAVNDPKSAIRIRAIELLGATNDAKYANLYLAALGDRSYGVIDAAAEALAATNDAKAYDSLTKLLTTPSWKGRIQIAGLNGLAALGDKKSLEVGLKYASDKNMPKGVQSAALKLVGATGKGDQRAFPLIFAAFKNSLENNDFQGIFDGTRAIITLADPRGSEAFDLLKEKFGKNPQFVGFITFLEAQFKAALEEK